MIKAITLALGLVLGASVATAQPAKPPASKPAPAPTPTPLPAAPADPNDPNQKTGTTLVDDKAGSNESLTQGGQVRPWATNVSPQQQQQALGLFREGNTQLNDGFFVKAVEKYREALKHWDHPAISYNLALALNNLDQPLEEYEQLEKAMRFGEAPLEKDKFDRARELYISVGRLIAEVEVSCDKQGAKVSVDGKEVFVAPGTYKSRVRIGKHTFLAEKEGYTTHINAPFIGPGDKFRIELKLYTAEELTRYNRKWQRTWVPYVVAGAGILIAGGGAALQYAAQQKYDDFDKRIEACNMDGSGCTITPALQDIRDKGDTYKTLSYVAFGVGAATVVTGITLAYLNRQQPYQIRADEYESEQRKLGIVSVAPVVAPGMAGIAAAGRF